MHRVPLNKRIALQIPTSVAKPGGVTVEGWGEPTSVWAHVRFLRAGESVLAARLEGRSMAIFTVRKSAFSESINTDWIVTYRDQVFNIRETPRLTEDSLFFEFLGESGVAV